MTRTRLTLVILLAFMLAAGCSRAIGPRVERNLITTEEMRAAGYTDAFTTVQSLRPQWLNARGATSIYLQESVKVYLDGSLLGGPDQLRQITIRSISSIRYMDAIEATQRWGLDHGLGAIVISTRAETRG